MGLCANYDFLCWGFVWLELSLSSCMTSWLLFPGSIVSFYFLLFYFSPFSTTGSCTFNYLFLKDSWTLGGKEDVQFMLNLILFTLMSLCYLPSTAKKKKSSSDNRYDFKNLKRMSVVKKKCQGDDGARKSPEPKWSLVPFIQSDSVRIARL